MKKFHLPVDDFCLSTFKIIIHPKGRSELLSLFVDHGMLYIFWKLWPTALSILKKKYNFLIHFLYHFNNFFLQHFLNFFKTFSNFIQLSIQIFNLSYICPTFPKHFPQFFSNFSKKNSSIFSNFFLFLFLLILFKKS